MASCGETSTTLTLADRDVRKAGSISDGLFDGHHGDRRGRPLRWQAQLARGTDPRQRVQRPRHDPLLATVVGQTLVLTGGELTISNDVTTDGNNGGTAAQTTID